MPDRYDRESRAWSAYHQGRRARYLFAAGVLALALILSPWLPPARREWFTRPHRRSIWPARRTKWHPRVTGERAR